MSDDLQPVHPFRSRLGLSERKDRLVFIMALGILSAVSPIATDMYLASMPEMAEWFSTPTAAVQLTLTTYMVGIALGQFVLGPLSDVLGRHKLMVAGNALFVVASLGIVFAPNIETVLVLRVLQGVAGAAGVVIARAVVSDVAIGPSAAQLYSVLALITAMGPVVAPLMGGVIATYFDWRTVFWIIAGFGMLMLACSVFVIPETLPPEQRSEGGLGRILRNAGTVLKDRTFVLYCTMYALTFGTLFAYISASPFVLQNVLGFSPLGYTVVFSINALGGIVVATVNTKLVAKRDPRQFLSIGVMGLATFSVLNLLLVLLGVTGVSMLVLLFLMQCCMGFILGNAVAVAQKQAQRVRLAGTGAAVLGCAQFLTAGIVAPLTGLAGEDTAVPMVVMCAICSVLALLALWAAGRGRDVATPHPA